MQGQCARAFECTNLLWTDLEQHEGRRLWLALAHAQHSKAAAWRRSVCVFDSTHTPQRSIDTIHIFLNSATSPQAVASVLEALAQEGRLTHAEMNYFLGRVLEKVDAHGKWK